MIAIAHSHAPQGEPSSSSAAAPSAAKTMLIIEIRFGETPVRASHALKRWTRTLPRAAIGRRLPAFGAERSEEHTSELQSLMRISYAVFCLKKKKKNRRTLGR